MSALNQISLMRPGHRVDLDAEGRHGEGVDDVGRGDQHADHRVDRHDQLVVDGEQARIDGAVFLAGGGAVAVLRGCAELKESGSSTWYS